MIDINTILQGDALELAKSLPDNFCHCIATSPPYWQLRDYQTGTWYGGSGECDHKVLSDNSQAALTSTLGGSKRNVGNALSGFKTTCGKCGATRIDSQMGLEETPEQYIENMVVLFRELRRVLRKDGTLWLNLGSSYSSQVSSDNEPFTLRDDLSVNEIAYVLSELASFRQSNEVPVPDITISID